MTPTKAALTEQLCHLERTGLLARLREAAAAAKLPLEYVLGICSRETHCTNELGDFRGGEYHGVGLMQADIQHAYARQQRDSGEWKTHPEQLIGWCCLLLASGVESVARKLGGDAPRADVLKIAAAAYNCGLHLALAGHAAGDCDYRTTGQDYGKDVMARMAVFAALLEERR